MSMINSWTNNDKLLWNRVSLMGNAHMAYSCFDQETRKSYHAVKENVLNRSGSQLFSQDFSHNE